MSNDSNERYVDPNSGAAPQPGGFAAPTVNTDTPEGVQAAKEAQVPEEAQQGQSVEEPAEDSGTEEQDYSDLLDKTVSDVEAYVGKHPEEKDAIIAAEQKREHPRKGVIEL